ncbi:hypothetical protein RCF98_08940 [Thiothrix lacustris]|uniref:Uncharacterized protein n=1 Tax=Thiothrix lacustris TaxID=525917 RepID=A0ABY9MLM0_9GAMM|nr:hypothetical protein [Thiothrix lacustris]WML89100.1 hypothetical protein RCF98_08940 [Thiothrix lacustris]
MSKMIKFNLTLNKCPVRDLDDLRENFNIDDLLDVYHNKVLHRWLEVRGLLTELDGLMKIKSLDNKVIATELCQIFHTDVTPEDIDAAVYPFTARQQQKQQLEQFASHYFSRNVVIDDYHTGYNNLCAEMRERSEDYPFLKTAINNLWKNYSQLLKVDFEAFFLSFSKHSLVLFSMLANDHYRQSRLFNENHKKTIFSFVSLSSIVKSEKHGDLITHNEDTNYQWKHLTKDTVLIKAIRNDSGTVKVRDRFGNEYLGSDFATIGKKLEGISFYSCRSADSVTYVKITSSDSEVKLPLFYSSYSGVTDSYWKDIVPKDKKCLILRMEEGNFVRNTGVNGEELNAKAVNGNFLIFDGIDYKSNNANHTLLYMVI